MSGADLSTFYPNIAIFYNIYVVANPMIVNSLATANRLGISPFIARSATNMKFVNCHVKGRIGRETTSSHLSYVGGFIGRAI